MGRPSTLSYRRRRTRLSALNRRMIRAFGIAVLPGSAATAAWSGRPATGYNHRSRVETQIGRWKIVIGPKLKPRSFPRQITEVKLGRPCSNAFHDATAWERANSASSPIRATRSGVHICCSNAGHSTRRTQANITSAGHPRTPKQVQHP